MLAIGPRALISFRFSTGCLSMSLSLGPCVYFCPGGWFASYICRNTQQKRLGLLKSDQQDGPHVLSMNVKVLHQQTFWFDQIQYRSCPSSNVPLDNSTVGLWGLIQVISQWYIFLDGQSWMGLWIWFRTRSQQLHMDSLVRNEWMDLYIYWVWVFHSPDLL